MGLTDGCFNQGTGAQSQHDITVKTLVENFVSDTG
uniref:Uncharacterized protein n=1 Tax=Arundo donax TaxID=35708 RepID=A0A0A9AKP9_ARUDO